MVYGFNAVDNGPSVITAINHIMDVRKETSETEDMRILRNDDFYYRAKLWYKYGFENYRDYMYYIDVTEEEFSTILFNLTPIVGAKKALNVKFEKLGETEDFDLETTYKDNISVSMRLYDEMSNFIKNISTSNEDRISVEVVANAFKSFTVRDIEAYQEYKTVFDDVESNVDVPYLRIMEKINAKRHSLLSCVLHSGDVQLHTEASNDYQYGYVDDRARLHMNFLFFKSDSSFNIFVAYLKHDGYEFHVSSDMEFDIVTVITNV